MGIDTRPNIVDFASGAMCPQFAEGEDGEAGGQEVVEGVGFEFDGQGEGPAW
jgi:hypothetical protein